MSLSNNQETQKAQARQGSAAGTIHGRPSSGKRVVETAYETLKTMILSNELPAGYQALEQDLANLLSISRTPVREVLTRLQEEGLVERIPRRGFRVLSLTHNDVRELYELLQCLEGKAVELFAARRPAADSPEIHALEEAHIAAKGFLDEGKMEAWSEADGRFHQFLIDGCGNARLARLATQVWEQVHRVDLTTMHEKPRPHYSPADHQMLLQAIIEHDAISAREFIHNHRMRGMAVLLEALNRRKTVEPENR